VSSAGLPPASRILVVGSDADVSVALHMHLERAGFALFCNPNPAEMEAMLRAVAPAIVVLLMPAAPEASWGNALTAAQSAARVGVRVMVVAPSREIVEPLAAVAGAERALARAEVLSRPLSVVERGPSRPAAAGGAPAQPPPPTPSVTAPMTRNAATAPTLGTADELPLRDAPHPNVDLMALIDEELIEERPRRPQNARVEVSVSLVSEHNFFVGSTRRIDSGGVFIASTMPPPVGTHVQVRLGLADGRKIDLEGEVTFIRGKSATTGRQPPGCGVRLHSLPGWAVDAIERFFLARQPILYSPT